MIMDEKSGKLQAKPALQAKPVKRAGNIIRVAETNLEGGKPVMSAIRKIPGVGFMFSNAVSIVSGFGSKKLETLTEEELKMLVDIIQNPQKFQIPAWMCNRRKDPQDGKNKHLVASSREFVTRIDINEMKKLKTYKGVRHSAGLPVRGQRTRSSFRKGKTIGVKREKAKPATAKAAKKE